MFSFLGAVTRYDGFGRMTCVREAKVREMKISVTDVQQQTDRENASEVHEL